MNIVSGILYSSNNKMRVREKFFKDLSAQAIRSSIINLKDHRFFNEIIKIRRNDDYSNIYVKSNPKTTLTKNLYWYIGVLEVNCEKIKNYLKYDSLVTHSILNGHYSEALNILDASDDEADISLASMSIRAGILSINEDAEKLKELSSSIDSKSSHNEFFNPIATNIINRYDSSSVFISDAESFKNQILRQFHGELQQFLLYKLTVKEPITVLNYEYIFNYEKNTTVIDMYLCLMSYIESYSIRNYDEIVDIIYAVNTLAKTIKAPLLHNLAHKFGISDNFKYSLKDDCYINNYTKGDYREVVNTFVMDQYFLADFQYMEIAAKAATRVGTPELEGLKGKILCSMTSLLTKDDDYEKSLSYLLCLCHCFSGLRWFSQLRIFVENEAKELNEKQKQNIRELAIVSSSICSPRTVEALTGKSIEKFVAGYNSEVGKSLTLSLWTHKKNILELPESTLAVVEKDRYNKYLALCYLENKQYDKAITVLEKLVETDDILHRYQASKMLIYLYLENNNYERASEEFVNECLVNKNLIPYYNSEKICEILKERISESDNICLPIVLSLHSRYINSNYDSALRYSFENILRHNDIKLPLQDKSLYKKYDEKLVDYFLEYVCTPDIMKLYLYFDSTKQIEECRIGICNHLISKDISTEHLINEVKERTKKLVISDAAKHFEHSRIYSDTSVFFSEVKAENILSLYSKYLSLSDNDYSRMPDELELQIFYKIFKDSILVDQMHILHILDMPLNDKNKCFLSLIRLMRDEFCYGDKGLNNYLSTRIRHGHLPTTLRKSVLDERLVTRRLAKSQVFKKNEYWVEKLACGDERYDKKLDKIFAEFSGEYEKIINDINDKWIQIYVLDHKISLLSGVQSKSEGLFNYSISNLESFILQQRIPIKTQYSEFVKHVIDWLWTRTDINLKKIRERINSDARSKLIELLNGLQKDINSLIDDAGKLLEFNDAVGRARTSLSANIEHILTWFERSDESSVENYDIETAIEIASRSLNVQVDIDIDSEYRMRGNTLTNMVDCLYIFFENAISKSNINKDELKLKLKMASDNGEVRLSITNKVQKVSDIDMSNKALDIYREKYGQEKIEISKLQKEGGTGFYKIWNIIFNGMGLIHLLKLGFIDSETFSVDLTIYNFDKVLEQ